MWYGILALQIIGLLQVIMSDGGGGDKGGGLQGKVSGRLGCPHSHYISSNQQLIMNLRT